MQSVQIFNMRASAIPVEGLGFVPANTRKDGFITQSLFDASFEEYRTKAAAQGMLIRDAASLYTPTGYVLVTTTASLATSTRCVVATAGATYVLTLMAANAVPAGTIVYFMFDGGGAFQATLTRAGSDTINGGTTLALNVANPVRRLQSNGVSAWVAV